MSSLVRRLLGLFALAAAALAAIDLVGGGSAAWFVAAQLVAAPAVVAVAVGLPDPLARRWTVGLWLAVALIGALLGDAASSSVPWLALEAAWATILAAGAWRQRPGLALLAALVAVSAAAGMISSGIGLLLPYGSVVGLRAALMVALLAWMGPELLLRPMSRPSPSGDAAGPRPPLSA